MNPDVKHHFEHVKSELRNVRPNPEWVLRTRNTLLMQVRNSLPTEELSFVDHVREMTRQHLPREIVRLVRGPIAAMLSVVIVVMGGSVASVSAAERSLPGDFLYSLKLATEQAQLAFTSGKEGKLKLKIAFASRRVEEIKAVVKSDDDQTKPDRVAQATEIFKRDLKTVKEQLNDMNSKDASENVAELAKMVDAKTHELVHTLQETKAIVPVESKENVTDAQAAAADTGVRAIEVMLEKHQESNDAIPEQDLVQAIQDHAQTIADVTGNAPATTTAAVATMIGSGTTTVPFAQAVEQMKVATAEAFAQQKTEEREEAILSASSTAASAADAAGSASGTLIVPTATSSGSSLTSKLQTGTTSTSSEPTHSGSLIDATSTSQLKTSTSTPDEKIAS